jgi:hypothetical protein
VSAVLAGMSLLQLCQLFSAVAGGTAAEITVGKFLADQIEAHRAAHPEAWDKAAQEQPELVRRFTEPDLGFLGDPAARG